MKQDSEYVYCSIKEYNGDDKVCTLKGKLFIVGTREYYNAMKDYLELKRELELDGFTIRYENELEENLNPETANPEIIDFNEHLKHSKVANR